MKSKKFKKILIIGLGPMGRSHFLSFYKKNYIIDLCDKKIDQFYSYFIKIDHKSNKINFYKSIPKNKTYDLVIISTNSKERLDVVKELFSKNKVKFLLLEKFIFPNEKDYKIFSNLIKKKNIKYIRVNSWGSYIVNKLNLSNFKSKKIFIQYRLKEGSLGTNLIHILDLFLSLSLSKKIFIKPNKIKVIKSKRKGYSELITDFEAYNNNSKIKVLTNSKKRHHILKINCDKKIYKVEINKSKKCILYRNQKKIKSIPFPYAKNFTEPFFKNCVDKKESFNNYNYLSKLSVHILKFIKKNSKRKIVLT